MEPEKPKDLLDWLGIREAPNWRVARPLGGFLAAALTLLFILSLIAAFAVIFDTIGTATSGTKEGINLGAGALVAAMLGAPFVIWGTFLKYQTVRYQKEGHITDRINKAVEQLGAEKEISRPMRTVKFNNGKVTETDLESRGEVFTPPDGFRIVERGDWQIVKRTVPNIEVRIGAILSLERIAQDSTRYDNGRDHVRVMEILCAYVRENSKSVPPEKVSARTDIAQALHVLGRRNERQRAVEAAWPNVPDRHTVWLFDTPGPTLPELDRGHAQATTASKRECNNHLRNWSRELFAYSGYRLNLSGANLEGIDLSAKRTDGSDAVFSGALFEGANLNRVNFRMSRLVGVHFGRARITNSDFSDSQLDGARMWYSRISNVDFSSATICAADFYNAGISETSFDPLILEATIDFPHTFGDASVTLPKGVTRPQHWPCRILPPDDPNSFETQWRKWQENPAGYKLPNPED